MASVDASWMTAAGVEGRWCGADVQGDGRWGAGSGVDRRVKGKGRCPLARLPGRSGTRGAQSPKAQRRLWPWRH